MNMCTQNDADKESRVETPRPEETPPAATIPGRDRKTNLFEPPPLPPMERSPYLFL